MLAVCINNEGYPASLEVGKLYRVVPDDEATPHGYIRVIDESGEDYVYSAERFFAVELPMAVGIGICRTGRRRMRMASVQSSHSS